MDAARLFAEYDANLISAESKYAGNTVVVKGTIRFSRDYDHVISLNERVNCFFDSSGPEEAFFHVVPGQSVVLTGEVKGRGSQIDVGYVVDLDQCAFAAKPNIQDEPIQGATTATQLYSGYARDQKAATAKYQGQVIAVMGEVSDIGVFTKGIGVRKDYSQVTMGFPYVSIKSGGTWDIVCLFPSALKPQLAALAKQQQIGVKGRFDPSGSPFQNTPMLRDCALVSPDVVRPLIPTSTPVPTPTPSPTPLPRAAKGIYTVNATGVYDATTFFGSQLKATVEFSSLEVLEETFRLYSTVKVITSVGIRWHRPSDPPIFITDSFGNSYSKILQGGDYAATVPASERVYRGYEEFKGTPPIHSALKYILPGAHVPFVSPVQFALTNPMQMLAGDRRVIIIPGLCSSSEDINRPGHWLPELELWLSREFGYRDLPSGNPDDELIEFSYSSKGWNAPYTKADTLRGITDGITNLMEIYGKAYPNAKFHIIAHSLGGVVTLDAMVRSPFLRERTNAIITVDSPIRGIEDPKLLAGAVLAEPFCGAKFTGEEVVGFRVWDDLYARGPTIGQIAADSWKGLVVVNMANTKDLIVPPDRAFFPDKGYPSVWDAGPDRPFAEIGLEAHGMILMDLEQRTKDLIRKAILGEIPTK
jgi:pimeloyl-ACP methyl ester carboxylesterase